MNTLLYGAVLLTALALVLILLALWFQVRAGEPERTAQDINIALCKDRLGELAGLLKAGKLTDASYQEAVVELEQEMVVSGVVSAPGQEELAKPNGSGDPVSMAVGLTALTIIGAASLYLYLGDWHALRFRELLPTAAALEEPTELADEVVQELTWHLDQNPEDVRGQLYLARLLREKNLLAESAARYEMSLELSPDDARIMVEYASFLVEGEGLSPRVVKMIDEAMARSPDNVWVLSAKGYHRFEEGDYPGAIKYWRREYALRDMKNAAAIKNKQMPQPLDPIWLSTFLDAELMTGRTFRHPSFLVQADPRVERYLSWPMRLLAAGLKASRPEFLEREAARATEMKEYGEAMVALRLLLDEKQPREKARNLALLLLSAKLKGNLPHFLEVKVEVSIDPELKDKVTGKETLVLFALHGEGRVASPLAARRMAAAVLPNVFNLSEANRIFPQQTLRSSKSWLVRARLSKSGLEVPQPGDLYGEAMVSEWTDDGKPTFVRVKINKMHVSSQ